MKSKHIQTLLRILLLGAGAGAGAALAFLCVQVHRMTTASTVNFGVLVLLYVSMCAAGMLAGHLLAPRAIRWFDEGMGAVERYMAELSTAQLAAMCAGLITGLLIAALLSRVLAFLGDSIFTLAASATLYVVLGVTGISVGKRRTEDFAAFMNRSQPRRQRTQADAAQTRLLDASVLMDGRVEAVLKTGFLGGAAIPDFVLEELKHLADAADEAKRMRGRRGLEVAERLKADEDLALRVLDTEPSNEADADLRLMTLARDTGAALVTNDFNLSRAARLAGLTVLNVNDLACALRPVTAAGDVLSVRIAKEGREAGQGVGYLDDGSMLVVEGGRSHVGQTVTVTVSSVLQTSAGRMVFAKMNVEA